MDLEELTRGLNLQKLNQIFQSVMKKQADKIDPIRSKFGKIEKEEVSVDEKIASLEKYAGEHETFHFRNLLELMKMGKISITQEHLFDDILICSRISG